MLRVGFLFHVIVRLILRYEIYLGWDFMALAFEHVRLSLSDHLGRGASIQNSKKGNSKKEYLRLEEGGANCLEGRRHTVKQRPEVRRRRSLEGRKIEEKTIDLFTNQFKQGQSGKPAGALTIETAWGESDLGSFWAKDVEKEKL